MKKILNTEDLANLAKKLRGDLSQELLAERLNVSKQAISKAENPETGSQMNKLRVRIIECLADYKVNGPVWYIDQD